MYGRAGLDRFKKAQSLEPFSVTLNSLSKTAAQSAPKAAPQPQSSQHQVSLKPVVAESGPSGAPTQQATQVGGAQSTWQPPDWAIEPLPGVYYLEVLKDGEVLDQINLDKRRHIFGRQFQTCDFVLDHQSVSRQHAAVVPHKNGSIYVIDLGSAHGTFVANERLTKNTPVELEVGQSLRFAASTRTYVLRKNNAALFPPPPLPTEVDLPPLPDPSDEEAVLAYNTILNRYGLAKSDDSSGGGVERVAKRMRRTTRRVAFKDQVGEELVEVVGISDGADVETEPGPVGVKEGGSLVGKYGSLVQITVIPKGKEQTSLSMKEEGSITPKGVTDKLQQVLNKVKNVPKTSGIYDDLFGESFSGKVGSSWAYPSLTPETGEKEAHDDSLSGKLGHNSSKAAAATPAADDDDNDDLFGD